MCKNLNSLLATVGSSAVSPANLSLPGSEKDHMTGPHRFPTTNRIHLLKGSSGAENEGVAMWVMEREGKEGQSCLA